MTPEIEIAVPTHNANGWLDDFFDSIVRQNSQYAWRIIARDDASTDDTVHRLSLWQERLRERLSILRGGRNLGMIGNYDQVLSATTSRWVMFADPDDVWKPGKMETCISAMHTAESELGSGTPIIICSDAEVVDAQLQPIADSYWTAFRMKPALCGKLHRLAVDCPVLTSTMMVNRSLLNAALPMTGAAACPDWWHAMVCCALGKIICLPEKTILYRRHSKNYTPVPLSASWSGVPVSISSAHSRVNKLILEYAPQARAFLERFNPRISGFERRALEAAGEMPTLGFFQRRYSIIRHQLWFNSTLKNVGLIVLA